MNYNHDHDMLTQFFDKLPTQQQKVATLDRHIREAESKLARMRFDRERLCCTRPSAKLECKS